MHAQLTDDSEAAQSITEFGLHKHSALAGAFIPIAGKGNMIITEGSVWKKWRTIFNPAFSAQQIVSQIPVIVECTEALIHILDRYASSNQVFRLEEEATKVTIDVIGRVVCDHDFKSLTTTNAFVETVRKSISWMPDNRSMNPFHHYNPLRPIMWKYYKWQMDKYMGRVLDERFAVRDQVPSVKSRSRTGIDREYHLWMRRLHVLFVSTRLIDSEHARRSTALTYPASMT